MKRSAVLLVALFVASSLAAQAPVRGGDLPAPLPLFPLDNWWNVVVTNAPVDPNNASYYQYMGGTTRQCHPDFGGDTGDPDGSVYGMPYIIVSGTQPLVPVVFDYDDESDYGAPGRPVGYPIPEEAKTQTKWIEGGLAGGNPDADGDRHMLIIDKDNRILYETWATRWNTTLNRWEAGSGATFPLDSNTRRPTGWTSADAAGLAVLPGLVRYDEVFGPDPIRHAFRVTVTATNGYVWPASHRAGDSPGRLPMGARLRLKPGVSPSQCSSTAMQKILTAMKTYGLIVADNGSNMYVSGTYDTRWNNDVLNPCFHALRAGDFEVIQLGWRGDARPPARGRSRSVRK